MTISSALQKAIDNLHILDIYLRGILAYCNEEFDPKYADFESLIIQTKHHVKESTIAELNDKRKILRVFIELGARWIDEKEEDEEKSIKVLIEAKFVAEYAMEEELEQSCIDEFSLKNASFHIWPYWRELLSSQCERMHIPRIFLPMVQFADNRNVNQEQEKGVETTAK